MTPLLPIARHYRCWACGRVAVGLPEQPPTDWQPTPLGVLMCAKCANKKRRTNGH